MLIRGCTLLNLGDSANVELVKAITGITPKIVNSHYKTSKLIYMCIGSVLGWANANTIIWGTGKMSVTDNTMFKEKPKKICAVRGLLTRQELIKRNFQCPKIYGDPFLLMSKFYPMNITKTHKIGIIPHQIEKNLIPQLKQQFKNALIIDVQEPVLEVIRNICRCEKIVSSALHGIICADSYNIPVIWIKMSEKILGKGFKYADYFTSINRKDTHPLLWNFNTTIKDIENKFKNWNSPEIDLNKLWEVCPFRR